MVNRQYDVCRNPGRVSRARIPYLIILQSDLLAPIDSVVVAPAVPEKSAHTISRLNPIIEVQDKRYSVLMQEMAGVPRSRLGQAVANAASQHREFIAAVDLLFTGV